jgi:hypothetical protein
VDLKFLFSNRWWVFLTLRITSGVEYFRFLGNIYVTLIQLCLNNFLLSKYWKADLVGSLFSKVWDLFQWRTNLLHYFYAQKMCGRGKLMKGIWENSISVVLNLLAPSSGWRRVLKLKSKKSVIFLLLFQCFNVCFSTSKYWGIIEFT